MGMVVGVGTFLGFGGDRRSWFPRREWRLGTRWVLVRAWVGQGL